MKKIGNTKPTSITSMVWNKVPQFFVPKQTNNGATFNVVVVNIRKKYTEIHTGDQKNEVKVGR